MRSDELQHSLLVENERLVRPGEMPLDRFVKKRGKSGALDPIFASPRCPPGGLLSFHVTHCETTCSFSPEKGAGSRLNQEPVSFFVAEPSIPERLVPYRLSMKAAIFTDSARCSSVTTSGSGAGNGGRFQGTLFPGEPDFCCGETGCAARSWRNG